MEVNSHFKQVIPYLVLKRGPEASPRILAYQRRAGHTEQRLGGLWSVGFGGHIEPEDLADRAEPRNDLVRTAALRELAEETGLQLSGKDLRPIGFINSDHNDVSSVHFGVVFLACLDDRVGSEAEILARVTAQAEPHQARWVAAADLPGMSPSGCAPGGGSFEDWSQIVIRACFSGSTGRAAELRGTS
jgi:predicted NUDIX family phosphoesterase